MRVRIFDDPAAVARAAADHLVGLVAAKPDLVLGLPTGRTPIPFYAELAARQENGALDLSRARAFNLDELLLPAPSGLAAHPASFRAFMERHAWERIGLDRARCEIPRQTADPEAECRRYEAALKSAGGLGLAIVGVGEDGHVAYNLPGQLAEESHLVTVPEAVAERLGVPPTERPLRAITLGLRAFRQARHLLLLATGSEKRRALTALLEGPADPHWPITLLRDHPSFDVLADRAAKGKA